MLRAGIIEYSDSPWSSPVLLITKKDGTKRFCIDYRSVNSLTTLTAWPLPTLDDVLDTVADQRSTYWSFLDLRSGYYQTTLDPETSDRTAFSTHDGNFSFLRVPFGLCGAVQFFQMIMQRVLRGITPTTVLIYLDDLLVMGTSPQDMFDKLNAVFVRFRQHNLCLNPSKCHWAVNRVKFLGHVFDQNGISVDDSKFDIIKKFPVPNTQKRVRSFLGLANYYRRFICNFSQVSAPLRALLKASTPFNWTPDCQRSFEHLKQSHISPPVLALPNFKKSFILTTDASTTGIVCILSQRDDGGRERVISYGGRGLRPSETRYPVTDLECLALLEGVKRNHVYIHQTQNFKFKQNTFP
jgi:hypothetical protein